MSRLRACALLLWIGLLVGCGDGPRVCFATDEQFDECVRRCYADLACCTSSGEGNCDGTAACLGPCEVWYEEGHRAPCGTIDDYMRPPTCLDSWDEVD